MVYCDFFPYKHTVFYIHTQCVCDLKSGDFKPVAHTVCITGNKWFIVIFLHTNTLCA